MWLHSSNSKFFESTVQSRSVLSSSCRHWGCLIERIPCNLSVDQCPVGGTPAQMTTLWGCGCLAYPHISSTFAVRPGDHSTTRFHLSWLSIGGMIFGVCAQLAEVLVSVNRAGKHVFAEQVSHSKGSAYYAPYPTVVRVLKSIFLMRLSSSLLSPNSCLRGMHT